MISACFPCQKGLAIDLKVIQGVCRSRHHCRTVCCCVFLQRRNNSFGNAKYSHYRRHDCSPELFSGFFCVTSAHFWKKSVSTVSAQSAALLVAAMGVQICYHTGLRVAGIHGMADAISPPSEMGYAAANTRKYTDVFQAGEIDPSAPGQAFCLGAYKESDMLYLGLINRLDRK